VAWFMMAFAARMRTDAGVPGSIIIFSIVVAAAALVGDCHNRNRAQLWELPHSVILLAGDLATADFPRLLRKVRPDKYLVSLARRRRCPPIDVRAGLPPKQRR
jgi:hypothetical protein